MATKTLHLLFILMLVTCNDLLAQYFCTPCKASCDTINFSAAGFCPHCNMPLILKSTPTTDNKIKTGAGKFVFASSRNGRQVTVHYYLPQILTKNAHVLFVMHGAGRNGSTYRDAWIDHANKYNLIILAPEYAEEIYPGFWNYNLAGMISAVKVNKERTGIDSYKINSKKEEWILDDFDEIFDAVKDSLKLKVKIYDMFGHSAGGQVLHRLAIYKPESKAHRILASNSGWYTVPDTAAVFPYGLKNSTATKNLITKAFKTQLIVFLGEKDNENEKRGDLVRSADVDVQGIGRLDRGNYFYAKAKQYAAALRVDLKWKLVIVPNVGHDHIAMGNAAAKYLYGSKIMGPQ